MIKGIKEFRTWLAQKLEVPEHQQLRRDAIIDKMGVTFTVALPGKEGCLYNNPAWPQVQITPFLWEEDHRLFNVPHDMPLNLFPGDQVIFTYHTRDHSGGCCPLSGPVTTQGLSQLATIQPITTGTLLENLFPQQSWDNGKICMECFNTIGYDDTLVTIEQNNYHESCYLEKEQSTS